MKNNHLYSVRFPDLQIRDKIWTVLVNDFFQNYFSQDDTVLDIGCGYGEFINQIKCQKKIGLDIDNKYKPYLNRNVQFIHAPSFRTGMKAHSIDKIFISNVFEHLSREDIKRTIEECRRILREDGEIIILQPNIRYATRDYWMFFDHITPVDDRALQEIFSTYNFGIAKKINRFLPLTTKSSFPKNPFFVRMYLYFPLLWYIFGKQSLLIFKKK